MLPVDTLKIDRSFVRDLPSNCAHRLIVQTTIALAHSLGMRTVAEGVETQEQRDILKDLGCDVLQGYLICRPAAASDVERWFATSGWNAPERLIGAPLNSELAGECRPRALGRAGQG